MSQENHIIWEEHPNSINYAFSCVGSIIFGVMAMIIPLILFLFLWNPWDLWTPIPTKGSNVFFFVGYCMFFAFLFWGLKVSIGRIIYRYFSSSKIRYVITEKEVIKEGAKKSIQLPLNSIKEIVIKYSILFKGIGSVAFVNDKEQVIPIGTDFPVEENEDDTKIFALTFYSIKNPEQVKKLLQSKIGVSTTENEFSPTGEMTEKKATEKKVSKWGLFGFALMGFGIFITPMFLTLGIPLTFIGVIIVLLNVRLF